MEQGQKGVDDPPRPREDQPELEGGPERVADPDRSTPPEDGDADGIDEVDVPDSTTERGGDVAAAAERVLGNTAETTGSDGDDGNSNGGGQGGGPEGFTGLLRALEAGTIAAKRANEAAQAGNGEGADNRLRGLRQRTAAIADAIERTRDDLPDRLPGLIENRLPQVEKRVDQALDAQP